MRIRFVVLVTVLIPALASAGGPTERFHAVFDASSEPEGPAIPIFSDGFESRGTCNWELADHCTVHYVYIPLGTGSGTHPFPAQFRIRLGAVLHILNEDTAPHRIHSDGLPGFPHQDFSMGQGQEFVVTPSEVGPYPFYCHDHLIGSGASQLLVE